MEVLLAEDDADTLIVKTALRYALARDVEVRVEDTDVVCLLIHHCLKNNYSLFVSTKAGTYDNKSIRANLPPKQTEHLLLSHSFSGCDTVGNIFGIGKVKYRKKLCQDSTPEEVFQTFKNLRATKVEIYETGVRLFQYLYSNIDKPLNQQVYDKYNKLMDKGVVKPEKFPRTSGAAIQHALGAYLQYRDWLLLESQSLDPREFGWVYNGSFEPVGSNNPIAPSPILLY